ncbi:50S ribosomal protein L1 [Candidatus Woesearchaeota archaeon CG10_big_fil_rev_8_21_14_0_10_44_13]|nr:MAG: 50S ribosomal protein L1 [Candidatus Woesearchaeota archaeon CG10_big_fil_rev_8_21_14_0_10_44_13]
MSQMDEKDILEAIKKLKEGSNKRNFTQTYDLIINLKGLDLKKPENQLDLFITLHHSKGREGRICALVGSELIDEARKTCEKAIHQDEFEKYANDKKAAKKLADEYDFFIAQANIMPKVASAFGKVLGPKKKMPNPKAGCVVPPKANLKPLHDKLQKTVRAYAKEKPIIQLAVGNEKMADKEVADNIMNIMNNVLHHVPNEKNNIKEVLLKLTMTKPVPLKV